MNAGSTSRLTWLTLILAFVVAGPALSEGHDVKAVKELKATRHGGLYVANRSPLEPSALMKLPIGSIRPRGWLRRQLETSARGMTGRLGEISPWCKFEGNSWADAEGKGHSGWEELPYWLKGYGDLGYVLHDETIIKQAKKWIDAVLSSQEADGWFGPRGLKKSLQGKPDLWPHMVMLNILQSYYEYTSDPRVLPFMTRYFRWQLSVPDADFLAGYWPKLRTGDNLESVYWLYNRSADKWLLELANKIQRGCADWTRDVIDWHGVNVSQGFRAPAIFFMQAGERKYLEAAERNYRTVMDVYGQFPGGGFAADENCRKGCVDPRQGFETCSMVEFMHSFEMLTKISGRPVWSDRCEEVAFNSLPAALTPDQKALHYLTGANMVQLDKRNHAPGIQNGGTMLSYSPFAVYRCCQHNVSHGWPYYAEELWLATWDGGLCASLYAASEVSAKVGDGTSVTITEETDYPFRDTIDLKMSLPRQTRFPLYLRVPSWCRRPALQLNGKPLAVKAEPLSYVVLDRAWKDGDRLTLRFPMELTVRTWTRNKNAVSVAYGPLSFSLQIGEKYTRYGGAKDWPEWEVFPTTAWNYGLVLDKKNPAGALEVLQVEDVEHPDLTQPFTADTAPIVIHAKAKKIPGWTLDRTGLVAKLPPSPVRSEEPEETVTLIPMGAARLRITSFPTIGSGPGAYVFPVLKPGDATPSASHVFQNDTLDALNDGELPSNSADHSIPRFTWWDHRGTREWVQYDFAKPRKLSAVAVYWFDDTGIGLCRVPESWRLLYKDGNTWRPVAKAGVYGIAKDRFNRVMFTEIQAAALRLEVQLRKDFSGGILEWKID